MTLVLRFSFARLLSISPPPSLLLLRHRRCYRSLSLLSSKFHYRPYSSLPRQTMNSSDDIAADVASPVDTEHGERRKLPKIYQGTFYTWSASPLLKAADAMSMLSALLTCLREVEAIISYLKPEVVFLELCASRIAILAPQNYKVPSTSEMIDMWKKKKMNTFGILYSWFVSKVADKLEVFPGAEFRVAYEQARSYGAKVYLGDRPVNITLRRTWGRMTLWQRVKFLYCMLFQTLFLPGADDLNKMLKEMDNADMLTLMVQEMSKAFPTLMETIVYERDMYMSSSLLKVAMENSSIVAVVGKGHLPGIKNNWKQPIELKHLLEVPANSGGMSRMKILVSAGAVVGVSIISCLYIIGKR